MFLPLVNGTVLRERYKLTRVVGQGGMGCVYRAEDLRLPGRLCAIKEVPIDVQQSAEMQAQAHDQFLREASVLAQLDHPNLPKVSDFFTTDGREYLVMDFVAGQNLKQIIDEHVRRNKLIAQQTVLDWATQILDALAYLYSQDPPVLHRDIKPSNIKLTPDNRIKLVDFGLVKLLAPDDRTLTVLQGRGTALYTPLEQYGGDSGHTTVQSDIYALGATLYHLLTAQAPPEAKTRFLNPHQLRPPHEINTTVSETVSDAVLWAMEMHPDDRPNSISLLHTMVFDGGSRPRPRRRLQDTGGLQALRANRVPALLALVLFVIAILLTVL